MPATSQKQARYFRWLEHAPDAAGARAKSGMSTSQMHDFSTTPDKGLPVAAPHKADGKMASNTTFQQSEPVHGGDAKRPEWMERAMPQKSGRPHMADGQKPEPMSAVKAPYRAQIRKTSIDIAPAPRQRQYFGQKPAMMADGKKPEKWMGEAFGSNKNGLHRATHTPAGETIPTSKVKSMAAHGTGHQKKMANAAINANPGRY